MRAISEEELQARLLRKQPQPAPAPSPSLLVSPEAGQPLPADPAVLRSLSSLVSQVGSMAASVQQVQHAVETLAARPQPEAPKPATQMQAEIIRDSEGRMAEVIINIIR